MVASGSPVMLRTMRNWSGSGARTGLTFWATGLYFFLADTKVGKSAGLEGGGVQPCREAACRGGTRGAGEVEAWEGGSEADETGTREGGRGRVSRTCEWMEKEGSGRRCGVEVEKLSAADGESILASDKVGCAALWNCS